MRAEETANEWLARRDEGEARLMLARVRVERFLADRGRELGLAAMKALDASVKALPADARPLRLKLTFLSKIGAWVEAHATAKALLQIEPGNPKLEGRFRSLACKLEGAPTPERAILDVERTGRFVGDEQEAEGGPVSGMVRPILRELASAEDVNAALYIRGATALIQGPRGATAERTARSTRSILSTGRSTARRLGLGQIFHIQIEGDFGHLSIAPGEADAGAVWSKGPIGRERDEVLFGLAGLNADLREGGR
jgi:predicted regulator of Ras-like GTPase activity (Roadblock/LC7/MglB family)